MTPVFRSNKIVSSIGVAAALLMGFQLTSTRGRDCSESTRSHCAMSASSELDKQMARFKRLGAGRPNNA